MTTSNQPIEPADMQFLTDLAVSTLEPIAEKLFQLRKIGITIHIPDSVRESMLERNEDAAIRTLNFLDGRVFLSPILDLYQSPKQQRRPAPEDRDAILRHMLGINDPWQRIPQPFRNYAAVNPGDPLYAEMERAGLVECYRRAGEQNSYDEYRCTEAGRAAALASYKTIQMPKSKRVYRKFLDVKDVFSDLTFKGFLLDAQFAETRRDA